MQVIRARNPAVFKHPEVEALMRRAFLDRPASIDFDKAQADFEALINDERTGAFIGVDDDAVICAVGIIMLPQNALVSVPQALVMYNEGPAAVKNAVLDAVVDFVKQAGYTTYWALNRTGRDDAVWARAFRRAGDATKIASVMQFEVP